MSYLQKRNKYKKNTISLLLPVALLLIAGLFAAPQAFAKEPEGLFGNKKKKSKKDPYSCKSKKGPNIVCSKPPRTKSRSKLYMHAMSKKSVSGVTKQTPFSYTQPRYNLFGDDKKNQKTSKKEDRGRQSDKR